MTVVRVLGSSVMTTATRFCAVEQLTWAIFADALVHATWCGGSTDGAQTRMLREPVRLQ
jgi:hypothetical protein